MHTAGLAPAMQTVNGVIEGRGHHADFGHEGLHGTSTEVLLQSLANAGFPFLKGNAQFFECSKAVFNITRNMSVKETALNIGNVLHD